MNKEKLQGYDKEQKIVMVEKAIKQGFLIIIPFVLILIGIYYIKYGWYDLTKHPWVDYFKVMGIFFVGFAIHELLHGLLYIIFTEQRKESLSYGYDPNYLKPYCNCLEPITIKQFRIVKILPLVVTGIIPYIIAIVSGNFHLVISSAFLVGLCGVDVYILILTRKVENTSFIVSSDNESEYGGIIYNRSKK